MPILDNNQVILSYGGGENVYPLNVSVSPNSLSGNQNSTLFNFTEVGPDLSNVSKRFYVFDDEGYSNSTNPTFTFSKPGNKKVSTYFYSDLTSKVGYAETNLTVYQPSGYTCDLISNCDLCAALTKESLSYNGPLVRLFRESDWQVADIPYNSFETLDTVSATTFLNLPVDDTLSGLPLDIMSPVKSMGFSTVRKLRTDYTGNAFRVRRSSDNIQQDIGFDVNGYVQLSAITNFLTGSTTGFCTTVYNQGTLGSIGDWVQTSSVNQPIVDVTSFSYPTLDTTPWSGSSGIVMNNRNINAVATNYSTTSKFNMFLITKSKTPLVSNPIVLRFGSGYLSSSYIVQNSYFTTSGFFGGFRMTNTFSPITDWHILTLRNRYDYTNDRRYFAGGMNNYEIQIPSTSSTSEADQPYTINLYKTVTPYNIGQIELGYTNTNVNAYSGWFSELILDDTDLTLNQFYKIKKYMASFQSLPYSASTNTGLRVNRIYNQKQSPTNGNHYIQNCVSNMPEFRITDPTFNRPTIYSVNTDTGDNKVNNERRVSSITYNGSNTIYSNTYTFINLYIPASGSTNSGSMSKNSSNSLQSYWYHNYANTGFNQIQIYNNNVSSLLPITSTSTVGSVTGGYWNNLPNPSNLKINSYRQLVSNGLRIMTLGTGSTTSSATTTNGTINVSKSHLFHLNGGTTTTAYRGRMFFDMSFGNIPTTSDWNNLIYPLLKTKYGAVDL
jgi:hypothetical protein